MCADSVLPTLCVCEACHDNTTKLHCTTKASESTAFSVILQIRTKALAAAAAEQREQTQQPAKQKGVAVRVEKPLQKKQGSKGGPGHKKKQQLPVSKGKGLQPHKHQQQGDSSSGDSIGASASDSASASSEDDEASSPKQQLIRHRSPSSNAVSKKQPAAAVKAGPASSSGVPVMQVCVCGCEHRLFPLTFLFPKCMQVSCHCVPELQMCSSLLHRDPPL